MPADPATAASDLTPEERAARFPTSSAAWAVLAEQSFADGHTVTAFTLRPYGVSPWARPVASQRLEGPRARIPWSHEPNRGFLRCLSVLAQSAASIGEADEAARCAQFLRDSDPAAADALLANRAAMLGWLEALGYGGGDS